MLVTFLDRWIYSRRRHAIRKNGTLLLTKERIDGVGRYSVLRRSRRQILSSILFLGVSLIDGQENVSLRRLGKVFSGGRRSEPRFDLTL